MIHFSTARLAKAAFLSVILAVASGCTKPARQAATPSDSQLTSDVSNKISSDQALSGQQVQSQVSNGVAVLTGTVESEAAKELAAADAQQVNGIRSVVNNLSVVPRN